MSKPYVKDPDAKLDYTWDWTAWLDGDTIASHTILPVAGITVESSGDTDQIVTAWISGGQIGVLYNLTCRIVTNGGRTDDRTISILVRSR